MDKRTKKSVIQFTGVFNISYYSYIIYTFHYSVVEYIYKYNKLGIYNKIKIQVLNLVLMQLC